MNFASELRHAAWMEPASGREPIRRRDRPVATVWDVGEPGFARLLEVCRAKAIFTRPMWAEMEPPDGGEEAQLRWFVARKCPDLAQAAIWDPGTYLRLLYRTRTREAWSQLSVGSGMTVPTREDLYRALWDVGVRELHHHLLPDNPHTKTVIAMGHFDLSPDPRGKYLHGVKRFQERP